MIEVSASVLNRQRFLHGMRADQLDALAATAAEVVFPAGHRIFADGGYVDRFRLFQVLARRLQDTRATLIARSAA